MQLFNGKEYARKLDVKITEFLKHNNLTKKLLIIQIGDNAESQKYINLKKKVCERLGVLIQVEYFSSGLSDELIHQNINDLVNNDIVGGVIIQLPLPRQSLQKVLDLIPHNKDVDLLSSINLAQFYGGNFQKLPPVVRAIKYFMEVNEIDTQNMTAVVIGAGELVGRPLSFFLAQQGLKVEVLDKKINYDKVYAPGINIKGDVLISAAGVPNLVKGEDISAGCHVIDFGSSVLNGKTVGDIDIGSKLDHLGIFSPSPGGMGPLVVRFLIINFLEFVVGKKIV